MADAALAPASSRRRPGTAISLERRAAIGQEKRERTRQKLLDTTAALLAELAFDQVTIDRIVVACGISRGTFYNHFDTRDDILRALGRRFSDGFEDVLIADTRALPDPLDRIALRMRRLFEQGTVSRTYGWLLVYLLPIGPVGTLGRQQLNADIRAAQKAGTVELHSVQAAVDLIQGSLIMAIRNALLDGQPYPIAELERAVLAGLRAKS